MIALRFHFNSLNTNIWFEYQTVYHYGVYLFVQFAFYDWWFSVQCSISFYFISFSFYPRLFHLNSEPITGIHSLLTLLFNTISRAQRSLLILSLVLSLWTDVTKTKDSSVYRIHVLTVIIDGCSRCDLEVKAPLNRHAAECNAFDK